MNNKNGDYFIYNNDLVIELVDVSSGKSRVIYSNYQNYKIGSFIYADVNRFRHIWHKISKYELNKFLAKAL